MWQNTNNPLPFPGTDPYILAIEVANFSTKYFILSKVNTDDEGVIK